MDCGFYGNSLEKNYMVLIKNWMSWGSVLGIDDERFFP